MVSAVEKELSFSALCGGHVVVQAYGLPAAGLAGRGLSAVDLVLLGRGGWVDLAGQEGWDDAYLRGLDELVDSWLRGPDRRSLVDAAYARSRGVGAGGFREVALEWLDAERLARLCVLLEAGGYAFPVYPLSYALGRAFEEVEAALAHTRRRVTFTDADLGLVMIDLPDEEAGEDSLWSG